MRDIAGLRELAMNIRKDVLRMTYRSVIDGGHLGGAFSAAEILAVLYGHTMNINPSMLQDVSRDRFILSKGHIALAHYAVLAETGFFPKEELDTFAASATNLPTHELMNIEWGMEFSSGSLGYGAALGVGSALMAKRNKHDYHVYVLLGDGECNEGSVWEAVMSAAKFQLDNLTLIIDKNGHQVDGPTSSIMPIHDFGMICRGFGCNVQEIDGHDMDQIIHALGNIFSGTPSVILANTIKGKGIPSIEGKTDTHHIKITEEQYGQYMREMEVEYGL